VEKALSDRAATVAILMGGGPTMTYVSEKKRV